MNRIQRKFVTDAMDNEEILTAWEIEFINNIASYDDDRELTDKQNEILNRISQKVNRGY